MGETKLGTLPGTKERRSEKEDFQLGRKSTALSRAYIDQSAMHACPLLQWVFISCSLRSKQVSTWHVWLRILISPYTCADESIGLPCSVLTNDHAQFHLTHMHTLQVGPCAWARKLSSSMGIRLAFWLMCPCYSWFIWRIRCMLHKFNCACCMQCLLRH